MKMAPRRSVKVINNNVNYNKLTINDVMCPICRSILIEPVTLPCNHGFCLSCFDGTMENATLTCPLCRLRIGSFLRSAKRDNKLTNVTFWAAIKETFPLQVKNKLNGIDEKLIEDAPIHLTNQGEIRREYEAERLKYEAEVQREREAAAKASEILIQQLHDEDVYRKQVEEEKIRLDERMAKELAADIKAEQKQKNHVKPAPVAAAAATKQGPLDKFFNMQKKSVPLDESSSSSTTGIQTKLYTTKEMCQNKRLTKLQQQLALQIVHKHSLQTSDNSADSIGPECSHFKPIRHEPSAPSTPLVQVPAVRATATTVIIGAPKNCNILKYNSQISAFLQFRLHAPVEIDEEEEIGITTVTPCKKKSEKKRKTSEKDCDQAMMKRKRTPCNSPPFLGFTNKEQINYEISITTKKPKLNGKLDNNNIVSSVKKRNINNDGGSEERNKLQEELDFELARKLHDELNNSRNRSYVTRKTSVQLPRKRQTTLDDLIVTKM